VGEAGVAGVLPVKLGLMNRGSALFLSGLPFWPTVKFAAGFTGLSVGWKAVEPFTLRMVLPEVPEPASCAAGFVAVVFPVVELPVAGFAEVALPEVALPELGLALPELPKFGVMEVAGLEMGLIRLAFAEFSE
jgi:hypothetical protein